LHELLEHVPLEPLAAAPPLAEWAAGPEVEPLIRGAMLRHDQDPRHAAEVTAMIHAALTTPLAAGERTVPAVAACAHVLREAEFLYPIPQAPARGFVKGFIDVTLEHDGRLYLVDWKSDLLPDYQPDTVAAHVADNYALQAHLYAIGAARMLAADMLFCVLRGMVDGAGVHHVRPSLAELRTTAGELARREAL
jgi:exodeoxyribonuclease V beta subunit